MGDYLLTRVKNNNCVPRSMVSSQAKTFGKHQTKPGKKHKIVTDFISQKHFKFYLVTEGDSILTNERNVFFEAA